MLFYIYKWKYILILIHTICIGYSIPGHILMTRYCIINLAHTFFVECHDYQLLLI